jgi:hypothetical protein
MKTSLSLPVRAAVLGLLLLASVASVDGATFLVPTDDEMIDDAEAIVVGTVREMHSELTAAGEIVTKITFDVELSLKKHSSIGATVTLEEAGGIVDGRFMATSASPTYWLGNRALVFVARSNEKWRTYGFSLGKFDFARDAMGREAAVRWALETDVVAWRFNGNRSVEPLRNASKFVSYIQARAASHRTAPKTDTKPAPAQPRSEIAYPEYVMQDQGLEFRIRPPLTANAVFPPSAYMRGRYRWDRFDRGEFTQFYISGTQPGSDSNLAALRGLTAWTSDSGSNVDYRLAGNDNTRTFVEDKVSTIVFSAPTSLFQAGTVAYAQWYGTTDDGTSGCVEVLEDGRRVVCHFYKNERFLTTTEGDVAVKEGFSFSQVTLDELVTHELGHTLGLRHSDEATPSSTDAVMKAAPTGTFGATLRSWDIEAVRTVYEPSGAPASPTAVTATATTATTVTVSWAAVVGATQYQILRSQDVNGPFLQTGTTSAPGTTYIDNGLQPAITYLYRVRAVSSGGTSAESALDHATTIIFVDDPLTAGMVVKAIHLSQIRQAVNAVRVAASLPPASWTDPNPPGVAIKAFHINELRNALTPALTALGETASYTGSITSGSPIRAIHFQELRNLTK